MIVEELSAETVAYGSEDAAELVEIDSGDIKEEYREIDRQVNDSMARLLSKDKR